MKKEVNVNEWFVVETYDHNTCSHDCTFLKKGKCFIGFLIENPEDLETDGYFYFRSNRCKENETSKEYGDLK